jgi:hypothetical protein
VLFQCHSCQEPFCRFLTPFPPWRGWLSSPVTQKLETRSDPTCQAICELVKRRLKDAGLPKRLSPHSFRVAAVTDLLTQGVPLEIGQPSCLLWSFCPGFRSPVRPTSVGSFHSSTQTI